MVGMRFEQHTGHYCGPIFWRVIKIQGDRALAIYEDPGNLDDGVETEILEIKDMGGFSPDLTDPATMGCIKWDA